MEVPDRCRPTTNTCLRAGVAAMGATQWAVGAADAVAHSRIAAESTLQVQNVPHNL